MEMPESEGLGVTAETRMMRQAEGVARMAQWFHMFITPARLHGLARSSSVDVSSVFALALPIVKAEGPPEALKLLNAAAAKV
jgi:chaperone required for assembly of F1-ATPase